MGDDEEKEAVPKSRCLADNAQGQTDAGYMLPPPENSGPECVAPGLYYHRVRFHNAEKDLFCSFGRRECSNKQAEVVNMGVEAVEVKSEGARGVKKMKLVAVCARWDRVQQNGHD